MGGGDGGLPVIGGARGVGVGVGVGFWLTGRGALRVWGVAVGLDCCCCCCCCGRGGAAWAEMTGRMRRG